MARLENTRVAQAAESAEDSQWQEPELLSANELETLGKPSEGEYLYEPLEQQSCCGEKLKPVVIEGCCRKATCVHCKQEFFEKGQIRDAHSPWIGVDLDGTLAADTGRQLWDSEGRPRIGAPIPEMVARVKAWVSKGFTVKIFTARASSGVQVAAIRQWLTRRGLPDLEVTNVKDFNMVMLWDDRCVQVTRNSGRPVNPEAQDGSGMMSMPRFAGARPQVPLMTRLRFFFTL
jgi:hypothetical protein